MAKIMEAPVGGLKHESVGALLWGAGGSVVRIAIQFAGQIILARILGPEPFGVFAVAIVIVFFSAIFADGGLAYGLIQRKSVDEADIRFVFTWQMLTAIMVALILYAGAPVLARFYEDQRLVDVLRLLCLLVPINGLGAVATSLCRRELDFKTPAIATIAGYAAGFFLAGVPMALAGFGVYALVASFLVQASVVSLWTAASVRHSFQPLFTHRDFAGVFTFGATVLGTRVAVWLISSIDRTIVGATLGLTAAGHYATINNLIYTPTLNVVSLLQAVLYSANAKLQGERARIRSGYCTMLSAASLVLMPVFVAMAAVPETLTAAILGPQWMSGAPLVTPVALSMIAMTLIGSSTPILWTTGRPSRELEFELPAGILMAVAIYLGSRMGSLPLIAWICCAIAFLRATIIGTTAWRSIGLSPRDVPSLVGSGTLISLMTGGVAALTDHFAAGTESPLLRLILVVAACGLGLALAIRALRSRLPQEVHALAGVIANRIPASAPLIRAAFGV